MHKNSVRGFDNPLYTHPFCVPNSIYTRIKLCDKQITSFID